jgi:hypothetical protein
MIFTKIRKITNITYQMIIKISTILFNIYDMILKFNESYNKEFLNKEIYFTEFSELISNRIDVTPMDTQNITKYFNNFKVPTSSHFVH